MDYSVSVIIPAYNVEKWLRECLDSVCGQSLRNIEIVCINDGSPDHSLEIMKEYAARDDRFLIIDKQNEGVGAARNDGIRAAHGEFVAFMDPDDKYPDSDTLRVLYNAAKEHDVLAAGGYFGCIDENSKPVPKSRSYYGVDFSCAGLTQYQDFQCDYQFQAYVFQREFLIRNKLFFPMYSRFQDPPFFVRTMTAMGSFYAVDRMTYLYRPGIMKSKFKFQKAFDLMCGITDNLILSKEKEYARLHFISAMRLLTDASLMVKSMPDDERFYDLVWKYIKTAGLIDEGLIRDAGYELPEPVLPALFTQMIDESKKYRALRAHKSVRAIEKLFSLS